MKKLTKLFSNILFITFILIILFLLITTLQATIRGENPSLFGHILYSVNSGSMSPTISKGSLIVVEEREAASIKPRDIVTYRDADTMVTHRVVEISQDYETFITRGDANDINDPFPVESNRIVGKVVFHISYIGYLLSFLKSKYGIIVLTAALTLSLYLSYLYKREGNYKS